MGGGEKRGEEERGGREGRRKGEGKRGGREGRETGRERERKGKGIIC